MIRINLHTRQIMVFLGALSIANTTTGCATISENTRGHLSAYNANDHDFDASHVETFVNAQIATMVQFERLSPPTTANGQTNYAPTVQAGLHYVDVRCEGYLMAVFWFSRGQSAAGNQTQLFGSSAAAALEILEASRELVGLTPLAFTLLNDTIDNLGDSLLFSLPPEVVSELVEEQQQAYRDGLASTYSNRATALSAIQGYAELCLATNIEAAAVRAVSEQRFQPRSNDEAIGDPPPAAVEGLGATGSSAAQVPTDTRPVVEPVGG